MKGKSAALDALYLGPQRRFHDGRLAFPAGHPADVGAVHPEFARHPRVQPAIKAVSLQTGLFAMML